MVKKILKSAPITRVYHKLDRRYGAQKFINLNSYANPDPASSLPPLTTIHTTLSKLDIPRFRSEFFNPALPVHITPSTSPVGYLADYAPVQAVWKWFSHQIKTHYDDTKVSSTPSPHFIRKFRDVQVPYEVLAPQFDPQTGFDLIEYWKGIGLSLKGEKSITSYLPDNRDVVDQIRKDSGDLEDLRITPLTPRLNHGSSITHLTDAQLEHYIKNESKYQKFHSFTAPLELMIFAVNRYPRTNSESYFPLAEKCHLFRIPSLYIAQAQLSQLPEELCEDLRVPDLVLKTGKGDIYDSNLWLGLPPTYTPLHKDPNPNLFVQIAGNKVVRLFRPEVGLSIFNDVQRKIWKSGMMASPSMRGDEMMQGDEKIELENAVWGCPEGTDGFEVMLRPGDSLFIPKGWWHSIKSVNLDVNCSVNWWFR
jgi:hypothetical protein